MKTAAMALAVAAAAATAQAQPASFDVNATRVPTTLLFDTLEIRSATRVRGLNDSGQTVGSFGERNWTLWGLPHGFIRGSTETVTGWGGTSPEGYRLGPIEGTRYDDPAYRYLDLVPAADGSDFNDRVAQPNAINDAGIVVGGLSSDYLGRGPSQAFRYDTRTRSFTTLSVPGALSAEATGINAAGDIVGNFSDASGDHGFLFSGGVYTVIDMPGEVGHTRLGGINDLGQIVGSAYDYANLQSFIYSAGSFTTFTANGLYTVAADINNAGQVVGWVGVSGQRRGFVYQGGQALILDLSASGNSTYIYAINNLGQIAGAVEDDNGYGFTATPAAVPEPAAALLALAGLCVLRMKRTQGRQGLHPATRPASANLARIPQPQN